MSEITPSGLRILVGAGSFADAQAAMRIVERLANTFLAGLGGVLVEEESLAICQIPNQRVIQSSGATMLAPCLTQLRTLIQADARAFRKSLARAAHPTGTPWSFVQKHGDLVHASLLAAASWDVLILGYRQVHNRLGKIVVLGTSDGGQGSIDVIADRLSEQLHARTLTFTVGDAPVPEAADVIRFETFEESLKALTRMNTEVVLMDLRQGPVQNNSDLGRLLEAARCPVIVFGAAATDTQLTHSMQIPPIV